MATWQRVPSSLTRRILRTASFAVAFHGAAIGQRSQQFTAESLGRVIAVAHNISDVFAKAQVSGAVEYNGKCGPGFFVPDLPPIHEPQKPYSQNPVETLSSMFSVDRGMMVSQGRNRIIRVVEAGVQTDILQVRIRHLSFNRTANPNEALGVALNAPEVQSFLQTHRIGQPASRYGPYGPGLLPTQGPSTSPWTGLPTISGELNNVTLADALDNVVKAFPGFWLYQDCENFEGQRVVYFGFFPFPGTIWGWTDRDTLVN
jgi:hypothetical protein